jgi:hypothetical protein
VREDDGYGIKADESWTVLSVFTISWRLSRPIIAVRNRRHI